MFLCDLSHDAFFNRKLNLSHLPKTNTSFAHLKAGVKRGRDALDDLRRRGGRSFEGSYTVNTSGKLGQFIKGAKSSVDSKSQMKIQPKPGVLGAIIHNHPRNSTLSASDLFNTDFPRKVEIRPGVFRDIPAEQVINTTPGGSYFRGYLKRDVNPRLLKNEKQKILDITEHEMRQLKPGKWTDKDLERRVLVSGHLANRSLANQGVIHYRAKLTPKDRRTLDFWLQRSPKLKSIYDG
jgi:hypothetical protein